MNTTVGCVLILLLGFGQVAKPAPVDTTSGPDGFDPANTDTFDPANPYTFEPANPYTFDPANPDTFDPATTATSGVFLEPGQGTTGHLVNCPSLAGIPALYQICNTLSSRIPPFTDIVSLVGQMLSGVTSSLSFGSARNAERTENQTVPVPPAFSEFSKFGMPPPFVPIVPT